MKDGRTILRVDATYHLLVQAGDAVRQGQHIQKVPDTSVPSVAPVSGTIESVQFDPTNHEFVIAIASAC
jgi:Na+-translocating ferredoxin:NAD+ oxidoreductase RnfC subunit